MCVSFQTGAQVLQMFAIFAHCIGRNLLPMKIQNVSPSFHETKDSPPMKGYFIRFAKCVECSQISHK